MYSSQRCGSSQWMCLQVCPEGSSQPALCPAGSIPRNNQADAADGVSRRHQRDAEDICIPCPTGKYCRGALIAGECLAGYVHIHLLAHLEFASFENLETVVHAVLVLEFLCCPRFLCGLGNWVPNPWMEQAHNEPYIPTSAVAAGTATLLTLENWAELKGSGYGGIPCPAGHYCPAGAAEPVPCPAGSVRQALLGRWISDCSISPAGYATTAMSLHLAIYSLFP